MAVVILNYLNFTDTEECVESLLVIPDFEEYICGIVIVDNNSHNESYRYLKQTYEGNLLIDIVQTEENLGFARGNNVGINRARKHFETDFIFVINNDTIFNDNDIFKELFTTYDIVTRQNLLRGGVLAPQIELKSGQIQNIIKSALGIKGAMLTWIELLLDYLHLHNSYISHILHVLSFTQRVEVLHGCALLFTPVFFNFYSGFYDKTFLYAEEQILYLMCKYAGITQEYVPTCKIYHKEDQSSEMSFGNDKHIDIKYNLKSYKWVVWWSFKCFLKKLSKHRRKYMNVIKFIWRNWLAHKRIKEGNKMLQEEYETALSQTMIWQEQNANTCFEEEILYLKQNGVTWYPFKENMQKKRISFFQYPVFWDKNENVYVKYNNKKLYCGLATYFAILNEQHENSPHRYFSEKCHIEKDDIFVDVGAAEGLLTLQCIDEVRKAYLIEANEAWICGLSKTFSPYKEKTKIIHKFASNIDDDNTLTLDHLLEAETGPMLIKIDVEGEELRVLQGAEKLLKRRDVKFCVCTYHSDTAAKEIEDFFVKREYIIEFSKGYMWVPHFSEEAPYMHKGILRAWKGEEDQQ